MIAIRDEELEAKRLEVVGGNTRSRETVEHDEERVNLAQVPEQRGPCSLYVDEAAAFRDGGTSALGEVVARLTDLLDLITFFTAGEKETRAWTLRRGRTALDAAATVHTDIARGFIRCEVIRWNDLVEAGSHSEAARRGLQRLEGKTYVVQDGDVLNIRFNV